MRKLVINQEVIHEKQIRPAWKREILATIEKHKDDVFFPEIEDLYTQFVEDQIHYTVFMSKAYQRVGSKLGGRRAITFSKFLKTIKNTYGRLKNIEKKRLRMSKVPEPNG